MTDKDVIKNKKRKLLMVLPCFPYPLKSGGHQALLNSVIAASKWTECTITYPIKKDAISRADEAEFTSIVGSQVCLSPYIIDPPKEVSHSPIYVRLWMWKEQIKQFIHKTGRNQDVFNWWQNVYNSYNSGFAEHINKLIEEKEIDIVQNEMVETLSLVNALPNAIKKVFVHHEIGYLKVEQILSQNQHQLSIEEKDKIRQIKEKEIALLNQYNLVVTLSNTDKEQLLDSGLKTSSHVSFATIHLTEPLQEQTPNSYQLSFMGPEMHFPNKQGLEWFLSTCWNKMQQRDTRYQLQIIGNWSESTRKEWSHKYKNICFTGYIDNSAMVLSGTILIVPILIGSGIRMKIVEAAFLRVPAVSTTLGASGLAFTDKKDILMANSPEEFVNAICTLSEYDLYHQIAEAAHTVANQQYSLAALTRNRERLYK